VRSTRDLLDIVEGVTRLHQHVTVASEFERSDSLARVAAEDTCEAKIFS
jgi:hypothetical protein